MSSCRCSLFDDGSAATTPWIVNLQPSGRYLMEDFFYAGGLLAVMAQIEDLLHLDAPTVGEERPEEHRRCGQGREPDVIRPADPPRRRRRLVVLRGNPPPGRRGDEADGRAALLQHEDARSSSRTSTTSAAGRRSRAGGDESSVMVLRTPGRRRPGMPEWGHLPIPAKLLKQGVEDLVRISDARMSGTSYGAIVLHVAPESAVGGRWRSSRTAT